MSPIHPRRAILRAMAVLLAAALTAPSPAFALRVENAGMEESSQRPLLERRLRSESPTAVSGLEEQVREFADLVQQVEQISRRQEKTGLLKKRIDQIESKELFTEGGVAFVPPRRGKMVVLGDRHGDFATLEKELALMQKVTGYDPVRNRDAEEPVYLVFVGDYTDVGKKTLQVLLQILRLKVEDPEHVVLISGNHDRSRNDYNSPDFVNHAKVGWFFRDLDDLSGGKDRAKEVYDQWQRLVLGDPNTGFWGLPNQVVAPNGLVVIHASPPNATLDAPEYGERFDVTQGLLGVARHKSILHQLSWNFISRAKVDQDRTALAQPNTRFEPVHAWQDKGFWTDWKDFSSWMDSFGGQVLVRGHDSEAPWDWIPYDGRVLTLMGLDWRSPDNGYDPAKKIPARFAVFDLAQRYDRIDPKEVLHFAWEEPAAGLEEVQSTVFPQGLEPEAQSDIDRAILEWHRSQAGQQAPPMLSAAVQKLRGSLNPAISGSVGPLSVEESDLLRIITETHEGRPRQPADQEALFRYVENASVIPVQVRIWPGSIQPLQLSALAKILMDAALVLSRGFTEKTVSVEELVRLFKAQERTDFENERLQGMSEADIDRVLERLPYLLQLSSDREPIEPILLMARLAFLQFAAAATDLKFLGGHLRPQPDSRAAAQVIVDTQDSLGIEQTLGVRGPMGLGKSFAQMADYLEIRPQLNIAQRTFAFLAESAAGLEENEAFEKIGNVLRDIQSQMFAQMGAIIDSATVSPVVHNSADVKRDVELLIGQILSRLRALLPEGERSENFIKGLSQARILFERMEKEILDLWKTQDPLSTDLYPKIDDWLAAPALRYYQDVQLLHQNRRIIAALSPRASALLFGRMGPHLRAEFLQEDFQADLPDMPVLLAGFLPYFQELLSRVERNRSAGISDPALGQEAQEYAGALWNGLMAPSYEGTVDAYKAHFESLKQALDQKTIQNLEETLGLTAEFFPERIPPEAPPRFVLFWNELMSDQEAAEILPYNRYNNRFGPPSISLWALTVGNPNAMPYVEDLPEHPFFGGTDRTSQGVIAGEKMVLIQMTQIYRFLHQRGREARASAGLEERRYRLEGPSGPIDIGVDVSPNTIAPAPVAFVFHGWTGSRNEPHILAVRKLLATMGYLVVAPDFRNHGPKNGNRSGGELDQLALAGQMEDLVRVIQFVREKIPDADLSRTVVGGHSLGGWTARQAAEQIARGTPGFEGMGLMAVADLSGILRPQDLGLPNADALKGFEGYDPLENLRRIPDGVRYLYVVGADDPRVSPGSAEAQLFLQAVEARGVPPLILSGVAHALADEKGAPAGTLQTVLLHLKERIPTLGLPEEEFTAGEPVRENTPYSTFQIGGRILLPGEKSGRNPGWARIITRKYPDGVSIETHQMDRHGRTVFNTGTSDTIQQLARRGAFYKPALKKPVLPPAVGLEENDYENRQTDPQQHNEQNFTYFVHMTSGMDAALVGSFLKTTGRGEGMLRHPEREHLISASILHRDPDSQVLGTYRSQRVGYILRVPQRNIVWVAPFDFISDRGERYLKQMLAERDQQGLLPFRELIEASQRYQTANEALIMGTTPDGQSRVETVGMVVLDTDSESWEQSWDEQLFDEARKAGLPIVTIRPEQRQNRLAQPIGAPSQAELDAFVKSLGVKSEVDLPAAQARLDAWLREQDRLYWEKRESYLPAVFRTQHAGLEENEYVWRPISPDQFTDDKTQEAVGRLREWLENPRGVSARAMAADLSALVGRAGLGTDYWRGSLQYQLESTMLLIQRTGGLQVLFEEGKYWNNLYDIKRFEKLIKTLGALFQKPVSTAQDAADALRALGRVRLTKLGTTTESLGFGYDTDRVGEFVGHLKKGRGIHWMGSFVEGFPGPDSDVDFRAHFPTNDFWIIHSGLLLVQAGLRQKDTGILKAHPYPYDVFGDPSQNKVPFPLDPNKLFIERDGAVYWNGDWLAELFLEMQSLRAQIRGEQAQNPLSEVEIAQQAAILLQQRLTGSHTAGLEEQGIGQVMAVLDEAAPQGEGILVLEARVLGRAGLEELVGRMGPQLGRRVILFGKESAAAKEAAARSGVLLVDSDDPADLALQLTGLEERVGRIGYVGDRKTANWLAKVLPSSMEVTPLDPAATLPELFRFLGYPASFLGQINASGLEESLERSRAA